MCVAFFYVAVLSWLVLKVLSRSNFCKRSLKTSFFDEVKRHILLGHSSPLTASARCAKIDVLVSFQKPAYCRQWNYEIKKIYVKTSHLTQVWSKATCRFLRNELSKFGHFLKSCIFFEKMLKFCCSFVKNLHVAFDQTCVKWLVLDLMILLHAICRFLKRD